MTASRFGRLADRYSERLGWSESKVKQYSALLSRIVTEVLELARSHQDGRVTSEVTSVTFTEGWLPSPSTAADIEVEA